MSFKDVMNLTIPQFFMFRQCQQEAQEARDQRDKMDDAFRNLRARNG